MALGYLNLQYESIVLPYDDEATPMRLTGKKILPAMDFGDKKAINESLDIIKRLDLHNQLHFSHYLKNEANINQLLDKIGKDVHPLCMPYWIYTKEFNEESRKYFQSKKEEKRGPFNLLIQNKNAYLTNLESTLKDINLKLSPYFDSNELTIVDILIASHLWGMYIFPEFQFPTQIHDYLQRVKKDCSFEYHRDFWA